jgi:hypothetical protein
MPEGAVHVGISGSKGYGTIILLIIGLVGYIWFILCLIFSLKSYSLF